MTTWIRFNTYFLCDGLFQENLVITSASFRAYSLPVQNLTGSVMHWERPSLVLEKDHFHFHNPLTETDTLNGNSLDYTETMRQLGLNKTLSFFFLVFVQDVSSMQVFGFHRRTITGEHLLLTLFVFLLYSGSLNGVNSQFT